MPEQAELDAMSDITMTKVRILPLRSVVLDGHVVTEGSEHEVDRDTAVSLIADRFADAVIADDHNDAHNDDNDA